MWPAGLCRGALVLLLLCGVVVCHAGAEPAAGKRVALVVGNSAYVYVQRLDNPGNDAKLMASTLQAAGFTLVGGAAQLDLDRSGFEAAVFEFGRAIANADAAVFYYSGHGLQVNGKNYLVPVKANPTGLRDLDAQMVSADLVLGQMGYSGARLNVVILDACRNDPFGGNGLKGAHGGLAEMHAPEGTLISYATQPGNVASDGDGRDSPYTIALAEAIRTPGLRLLDLFNQVGLAVKKSTAGEQQPWMAASPLEGVFYFSAPPPTETPQSAPTATVQPTAPTTPTREPNAATASLPQLVKPTPAPSNRSDSVPVPPPAPHHDPAVATTATKHATGACSPLLQYISSGAERPSWADIDTWRHCGGS